MPDFVSRKRLKKKVIDRWENEGGNLAGQKTADNHPPPKRKRKIKNNRSTIPGGPA